MRSLLLLIFSLAFSTLGHSQLTQPCVGGQPISYDDCSAACAVCDISVLNGVTFSSGNWTPDHVAQLSYTCDGINIIMNNNGWVGFVANAPTLELQVTYSNCTGGNGSGIGMQALIVESSDCQNFSLLACKGDASAAADDNFNLIANGLTVGQSYYLVLDGFAGSECDVSVDVIQGGGTPQVGTGSLFGPQNVCPNETVEYTFGPVDNALYSDWQLPAGATIDGSNNPTIALDPNGPITVNITFGPNSVSENICVTPFNGCDTGNPICIPVTVTQIPDTQLPPQPVCYGETYIGIDGTSYTNNNSGNSSYIVPLQEYFGGGASGFCDSLVLIDMIYLPNIVTNGSTVYACEGDTIYVGSTMVLDDQQISGVLTSYNGCDSIVNVFVEFIDNNAGANGPLSISCTNNAQLVGNGTTATGSYAWYDPTGTEISTSLTASAVLDGQHYFVVSNTANGFTCTDTAFVDVTADFSLPQNVTASAAGQIGCGANSSTQLTGSTTTSNALYEWLDPSNSQISTTTTATATQTGTYQFIVTNPLSGCKDTLDVPVTADASIPDILATGGIIDCNTITSPISVTSSTSPVNYSWTGPGGYTSTTSSDVVSATGSYSVTVTDPSNGCTNATAVIVADSTTPPSIVTTGNIVGCNATGVTITASSNTGTSYSWTGPSGYTSSMQNPADITNAGNYTVVVTNPNGCTNSDIVIVTPNTAAPTVSPTGGLISCTTANVTILANSTPNTDVSYAWTGPSGTPTSPSFVTSIPGLYEVTVTNTLNGCTETGSINVAADTVSPTLTLTADNNLIDCNNQSVVLTATSNGVSYLWGGGITGNSPTVTVTQQGNYNVEVTGTNGCVTLESINIQEDTAPPDVSAADVDITCLNTTPTIDAISTVGTTTFSWTGPNGFTANTASASITDGGQYFVTVTNTANGCTNTTSLMATDLVIMPTITTTNDSLGCGASATAQLTATSTGTSYSWTGPGSYSGTGSAISVPSVGVYTVVVTDVNGCTNTATAEVYPDIDLPQILAVSDGSIDCSATSTTTLTASSTTGGITPTDYVWTGPSGTSTGLSVTVSTFDAYTVVVTAPNGCTSSASITANSDTIPPALTGLAASNDLDCNSTTATLSATTNGSSYTWTGPNGFSDSNPTATVSDGGIYTLIVAGANNCTATQDVTVLQDTLSPDVMVADASLDCIVLSATLTATSNSSISGYSWTGPGGFTGNTNAVSVMDDGVYTVVVTSSNGCTNTTNANVSADQTPPVVSAVGGTITCLTTSIDLMGNSTLNTTGEWTLNGAIVANDFPLIVTDTGSYVLTVTAANGCVSDTTVVVDNDIVLPDADAVALTQLSCTTTSVTIDGNSNVSNANFDWVGPNGFTSNMQHPNTITDAGLYTLTVTNPTTGCTNMDTVTVFLNANLPELMASVDNAMLDCNNTSVNLTSLSNTTGVTYSWTGPGIGATPTAQNQNISIPGNYTIEVVAPNGCVKDTTITVQIDTLSPNVMVLDAELDCVASSATLTATSNSTISDYAWMGPNSFTANTASVSVSDPGLYTVVVTTSNGCTNTTTGNVAANQDAPNVSAVGGTITCLTTMIDLMGSTSTANATGEWTFNGTTVATDFPLVVSDTGSYILTVTAVNGCVSDTTIMVDNNIVLPDAVAASLTPLSCTTTSVSIEGNSDVSNAGYSWIGPNGFTSNMQNPNTVTDPGLYTLTVINPTTGCTNTDTTIVLLNANLPELTASVDVDVLDCNITSVNLTSSSNTMGVSYNWTGPGIGGTPTAQDQIISIPGNYIVTVLAPNGCTHDTTIMVQIDTISPQGVVATGGTILCGTSNITLSGNSSTSGVSYSWVGPGSVVYPGQNPTVDEVGLYTLTVESLANGCTATDTTNVAEDINAPNATVSVSGTITCINSSVEISGESTTSNVTFAWTTPVGGTLSGKGPHTVSDLGSYKLVVTAPNGCSTVKNIATPIDTISPGASTSAITLTCQDPNGALVGATNSVNSVSYSWTGPNSYTNANQTATGIVDDGTYNLLVTDDVNGCTSMTSVVVASNQTNPDVFANDAVIDCNTPSLQINAGSATNGVSFSWVGPSGFTSTDTSPLVTVGGQYTLTVSDPATGCTSTAIAQIDEDKVPPNVSIDPASLTITCAVPNVTIIGSSTTVGASFDWSGPNGYTSNNPSPTVTDPGLYTLTVKGSNGCTATADKNIDKDSDFPVIVTQVNGVLTCAVNAVDIEVSETSGKTMTYSWSGPGSFSSTDTKPSVALPGTYTVEGTAANGCKVTSQAIVDINDTKPTAVAGGGFEIDCEITEGTLNIDGSALGTNITYQWSTAQGHIVSGGDTSNPLVDGPGTYELTVVDADNGCSNTAVVEVTADPAIPNELKIELRQISCYGDNDGVASIQGVVGGTAPFQYSFNDGPFSSEVNFTNLGPGDYPITVVDINGCKLNTGVSIVEPKLFTIDLGPDQMVEYGTVVTVNAQVEDTKKVGVIGWNTFLDSTCLFTNPMECYEQQFIAEKTTTFEVAATDTSGCNANDRMIVFVAKPKNVYFPNIFSPNGDNNNDLYLGSTGKGVALIKRFSIYDRWGNLMMELNDIQPGQNILLWDGRFKGKAVSPGVYIYRAEIFYLNGDRDSFVGDITLIR